MMNFNINNLDKFIIFQVYFFLFYINHKLVTVSARYFCYLLNREVYKTFYQMRLKLYN